MKGRAVGGMRLGVIDEIWTIWLVCESESMGAIGRAFSWLVCSLGDLSSIEGLSLLTLSTLSELIEDSESIKMEVPHEVEAIRISQIRKICGPIVGHKLRKLIWRELCIWLIV